MIPSISCAHTSTFLFGIASDDDDEDDEDDEDDADDGSEEEVDVEFIHIDEDIDERSESEDKEPCGIPFL